MKRIFAFILTATLLCAMFIMPSAAADNVNYADTVDFTELAPVMDGVVSSGEYGSLFAKHSYSANPDQFVTEFDQYGDWDVEFYSAWDKDNLYFAWVVKSAVHAGFPKQDFNGDGVANEGDYGYMWEYSCVQFILTPNDPTAGDYTSNYLEVGLCLMEDEDIGKVAWNYPTGVKAEDINVNSWNASIKRDDAAGTTTYEVTIPKTMTGFNEYGTDAKFGFSYAVAAQEHFSTVKNGMLEWQDACLGNGGVKIPGNCAVMTLAGGDGSRENINEIKEGTIPEDAKAEGILQLPIDRVNDTIKGEDIALITDLNMTYNGVWALNILLNPVEGEENTYVVADRLQGDGNEPVFSDVNKTEGSFILAVHSAGIDANGVAAEGYQQFADAAGALEIGTKVKLFGVDVTEGKMTYTNAMVYTVEPYVPGTETPVEPDTSTDTSDDASADASTSTSTPENTSKEPAKTPTPVTSASTSTASTATDTAEEDGGFPVGAIIGIIAGVVVVAVVVVVVISKKKN